MYRKPLVVFRQRAASGGMTASPATALALPAKRQNVYAAVARGSASSLTSVDWPFVHVQASPSRVSSALSVTRSVEEPAWRHERTSGVLTQPRVGSQWSTVHACPSSPAADIGGWTPSR